jgi:hypothetical protein
MTSSARGSDLNSWWSNRASLRKEAWTVFGQLRDCQGRLSAAAGDTPTSATAAATGAPPADSSIAGLTAAADQILIAITHAQGEIGRLASARTAAQSELAGAEVQVALDARRRVQDKSRMDAERRLRSRKAMGWATQKFCRLASLGVVALMLYLLAVY